MSSGSSSSETQSAESQRPLNATIVALAVTHETKRTLRIVQLVSTAFKLRTIQRHRTRVKRAKVNDSSTFYFSLSPSKCDFSSPFSTGKFKWRANTSIFTFIYRLFELSISLFVSLSLSLDNYSLEQFLQRNYYFLKQTSYE